VDTSSREVLTIKVGTKLTGLDVIDTLKEIEKERGCQIRIKQIRELSKDSTDHFGMMPECELVLVLGRCVLRRSNCGSRITIDIGRRKSLNDQTRHDFAPLWRGEKILLFAGPEFG